MEPYLLHPELHYRLDRLEQLLGRGGKRPAATSEVRRVLSLLYEHFRRSGRGTKGLNESFHMLARRAERARSGDELRDVVRDARQFALAVSSFSQTQAMEERLHELEGRLQGSAQAAAADSVLLDDDDVVTLESLESKRVLFAIMPFADEFTDVWAGGVKRAASGTGLTPVRIDMITKTSEITDDIVRVIRMAEVVVVDVTRNNPNVMFEFGFALAIKKAHVVISQSTEYLTFDIKNLRSVIHQNSWQGIESLHKDLQSFIRGAGSTVSKGKKKRKSKTAKGSTASQAKA
jgi:hypothetical protein